MPWYILALLVSVPVIALSTWASRKGNLPLVLAMLAVALVFVGATHGWVPALSQREGSLGCVGRIPVGVVHRPDRPDPGPPEKTSPISVS